MGVRVIKIWRDESRDDFDGETSILAGVNVQDQIQENLNRADLLLLLDTPRASESHWIKLEINMANGDLIPILPVTFLTPDERQRTSRFRSLATLQRGCSFTNELHHSCEELTDIALEGLLVEVEIYLSDIFRRKLRIPFLAENEFTKRGYSWTNRDKFIYEALRNNDGILRTRVFSHCSYFEGIYDQALLAFIDHLDATQPRANYALYVYDGTLLPQAQIQEIRETLKLDESTDVIILHHQEIAALLHTNFTSLKI